MAKERIDIILTQQGIFESREKAKAALMAGSVYIDGQKVLKAGTLVDIEKKIEVRENTCPYVGRGGLKLEKAINDFNLDLTDAFAIDMGASTGGFTDCMLQNGAKKVYSIDVGYGQLDYKLRTDDRVVNLERTNIRHMDTELILEPIDFISIDVSFISVKLILPVASKVLKDEGQIVVLAKPQFEAGRDQIGKKGIVRDEKVHKEVIENVIKYGQDVGLKHLETIESPITGAKGNKEFLLLFKK